MTSEAGIDFVHENGESGRKWFPEWLGGGCAFLDFDQDGDLDLFLVNGAPLPGWEGREKPTHRLYRNDGAGKFSDISRTAGVAKTHYGFACAAVDYDGDRDIDLFVTGFGGNLLLRNRGDGTFEDATAASGLQMRGFPSGCAFGDYDGDGDLDLYVARYVHYALDKHVPCRQFREGVERLVMCMQTVYDAAPHALFRNDGKGHFTDVSSTLSGIEPGRGLGVLFTDLGGHGTPDLYVANDFTPNYLLRRSTKLGLQDVALRLGTAMNESGQPQASMGVASADVDGDGRTDLAVTNFAGEYTTLYQQEPSGNFRDISARNGLLQATGRVVGFGIGLEDFDLDGRPDLFQANGHVTEAGEQDFEGEGLAQPKVVLRNEGPQFRRLQNPWVDAATARISAGRGAAFGDYDGDGDVDVLVTNLHGEPDLLRNETVTQNKGLRVRVHGTGANWQAIGARVSVRTGSHWQVREVQAGSSYFSQNELALTFGLGETGKADEVRVQWPGGALRIYRGVPAGEFQAQP